MSDRQVIQEYYPPGFDPNRISRTRKRPQLGPKFEECQWVVPFTVRCSRCGDYVYKGRRSDARKETTGEKYKSLPVTRLHIRCPSCSSAISFKIRFQTGDYVCDSGAQRSRGLQNTTTPAEQGTIEQSLDRLERREEERHAIVDLEAKALDAKREKVIADALDKIRLRNERAEHVEHRGREGTEITTPEDDEYNRTGREDVEAARHVFEAARHAFKAARHAFEAARLNSIEHEDAVTAVPLFAPEGNRAVGAKPVLKGLKRKATQGPADSPVKEQWAREKPKVLADYHSDTDL
ncbi:putative Splicing factor YJU2 [Seiridium cardinale]|uniref:Splicing factor YJU2 n=1 Tax=Seiridium cardinale TaxID=138064 RepID=A0ABR2XKK8_9PEZI